MNARSILTCTALVAVSWGATAQEQAETQLSFDGDSIPSSACSDGNNETECVIELRVEDTVDNNSCRVTLIKPSQDLITFVQGFKDKFVYWRIKEQPGVKSPYRFGLRDGISFVDDPRPRTFVGLQRGTKDPTSFRARNKFNRTTVFKYVVNVTNETETAAPSRECSLDPWFRNR
jgi:hypothetical protein